MNIPTVIFLQSKSIKNIMFSPQPNVVPTLALILKAPIWSLFLLNYFCVIWWFIVWARIPFLAKSSIQKHKSSEIKMDGALSSDRQSSSSGGYHGGGGGGGRSSSSRGGRGRYRGRGGGGGGGGPRRHHPYRRDDYGGGRHSGGGRHNRYGPIASIYAADGVNWRFLSAVCGPLSWRRFARVSFD